MQFQLTISANELIKAADDLARSVMLLNTSVESGKLTAQKVRQSQTVIAAKNYMQIKRSIML